MEAVQLYQTEQPITMTDFLELKRRAGLTAKVIADRTGYSISTVNRALKGTATEEALRKISRIFNEEINNEGTHNDLASYGQRMMLGMLEAVWEDGEFALITGPSGMGKTYVIQKFSRERPDALTFSATDTNSIGSMLGSLCSCMGLATSGTVGEKFRRITNRVDGKFFIVDEADLLVRQSKDRMMNFLEIFRQLHQHGARVVLIGLSKLYEAIAKSGETYVYSRIGYYQDVPSPSVNDLIKFWTKLTDDMPTCAHYAGAVSMHAQRAGYFRYLQKLASRTRKMDGDVEAALPFMFSPKL